MLRGLELSADAFAMLKRECDAAGIGFLSSPFDSGSIKLCLEFHIIRSGSRSRMHHFQRPVHGAVVIDSGFGYYDHVILMMAFHVVIGFLSSPFDSGSIKLLSALDMDFWKIPSGEITNMPYLREVAGMRQPGQVPAD